jgi:hypothetical protein
MLWYKDTRVGKGSALAQALSDKKATVAAGLYAVANAEFKQRYPQCTKEWFERVNAKSNISNVES